MDQVAATLGAAGFAWLLIFQVLLVLSAPLGHLAWGGQSRHLTRAQRIGSAISVLIAALGLVTCGQRAGWWTVLPNGWLTPVLIALAALFALSFVGNAMSSSRAERLHGVPLTILLSLSCLVLIF